MRQHQSLDPSHLKHLKQADFHKPDHLTLCSKQLVANSDPMQLLTNAPHQHDLKFATLIATVVAIAHFLFLRPIIFASEIAIEFHAHAMFHFHAPIHFVMLHSHSTMLKNESVHPPSTEKDKQLSMKNACEKYEKKRSADQKKSALSTVTTKRSPVVQCPSVEKTSA